MKTEDLEAAGRRIGEELAQIDLAGGHNWGKFNAARKAARGAARRATKSAIARDPDGASRAHSEAAARMRELAKEGDAGDRILYERGAQVHEDAATAHRDVRDGVGDEREALKQSEEAENFSPKGDESGEPDATPTASAGRSRKFQSSEDAYNDCQTDGSIKNGDSLVVDGEGVVGLAWTWPLAVTKKNGELHTVKQNPGAVERLIADAKISYDQVKAAVDIAKDKGYPVNPMFEDYIAKNAPRSQRERDGDKFAYND